MSGSEVDRGAAAESRHGPVGRCGHQQEVAGLQIEADAIFPFDVAGSFDNLAEHHNVGWMKTDFPCVMCLNNAPKDPLGLQQSDDLR